ncbi:hypothetical protein GCM10009527_052690 [Actinomadura nitritigenes]
MSSGSASSEAPGAPRTESIVIDGTPRSGPVRGIAAQPADVSGPVPGKGQNPPKTSWQTSHPEMQVPPPISYPAPEP